MISDDMQTQLSKHLNVELFSSYLYLAMATYCRSIARNGFANWLDTQAQEEFQHGKKFYDYLAQQDANIELLAIDKPDQHYASLQEVFDKVLAHEQHVTKAISNLVDLATKEKDHATQIFLQWFVTEQIEEENSSKAILDSLKQVSDSKEGLFLLDMEMGKRVLE